MKIPCIICFELSECNDKRAIAKICDNCKNDNTSKVLKNINNYKQIKDTIDKNNKKLHITDDGEII